jgi:uncharacterized membrane protein
MELSLDKLANIAQIISVPLTILVWLFTREKFAEFWRKRGRVILAITVVLALVALWRIGWLNWLQYQVTWPIWGLLLYPLVLLCVLVGIVILIVYIDDRRNPKSTQEYLATRKYYTIHGARWYLYGRTFRRPPVCARCLMEMRNVSMPIDFINPIEAWECRQCGHEIRWDAREKGDLLEDIGARYNAELRRRAEENNRT